MIIDLILDRKDFEEFERKNGCPIMIPVGSIDNLEPYHYSARKFYGDCMGYGSIGDDITRALDYGTEEQVKQALCKYIIDNEYNPKLCDYINSVDWLI